MTTQHTAALVAAARAGDPHAQDELVGAHLPLVYNIVGRALGGSCDVDDVVQDTMLRALDGLGGLRVDESFRSWLVAIAMNRVRAHWQARQSGFGEHAGVGERYRRPGCRLRRPDRRPPQPRRPAARDGPGHPLAGARGPGTAVPVVAGVRRGADPGGGGRRAGTVPAAHGGPGAADEGPAGVGARGGACAGHPAGVPGAADRDGGLGRAALGAVAQANSPPRP